MNEETAIPQEAASTEAITGLRKAEILVVNEWHEVPFLDIKKGMTFRLFEPDGTPVGREEDPNDRSFVAKEDARVGAGEDGVETLIIDVEAPTGYTKRLLDPSIPATSVCLYHSRDFDGKCSAAIVRMFLEEQGEAVTLFGIDYGEEVPLDLICVGITKVFMVDFSLKPEPMFALINHINQVGAELIWIDHHESAIDLIAAYSEQNGIIADSIKGIRKVGTAGCELCWDYLFPGEKRPQIVTYLGRYDAWEDTRDDWESVILPFQWGMKAMTFDPDTEYLAWKALLYPGPKILQEVSDISRFLSETLRSGHSILCYQREQDRWYVAKYGHEVKLRVAPKGKGKDSKKVYAYKVFALNTGIKTSQTFRHLWDKYDLFIAYVVDHGKWNISIYNVDGKINVSKIAVDHKGGGHAGAAGWICEELPFV
jgi:oligoribonuclease NrnB/cAMP/cGMP phosphodiesterase (DHH superfamily)